MQVLVGLQVGWTLYLGSLDRPAYHQASIYTLRVPVSHNYLGFNSPIDPSPTMAISELKNERITRRQYDWLLIFSFTKISHISENHLRVEWNSKDQTGTGNRGTLWSNEICKHVLIPSYKFNTTASESDTT